MSCLLQIAGFGTRSARSRSLLAYVPLLVGLDCCTGITSADRELRSNDRKWSVDHRTMALKPHVDREAGPRNGNLKCRKLRRFSRLLSKLGATTTSVSWLNVAVRITLRFSAFVIRP